MPDDQGSPHIRQRSRPTEKVPLDYDKFGKLMGMVGSTFEGEALNAHRMATDMLRAAGLSFTDIAETLKAKDAVQSGHPRRPPPRPKGFKDSSGRTWRSQKDYEEYCAREAARSEYEKREAEKRKAEQRAADRQRHAPQRDAVVEKYGSAMAAITRNEREQALHDAVVQWLEGPRIVRAFRYLAGRWHSSMGGWTRGSSEPPVAECRAALDAALPLPQTIREARDEVRYWDQRDNELQLLVERWDEEQLDLPASYRRRRVRRLYETELSITTLDDLQTRLQFLAETKNGACEVGLSIMDAFERLVLNGQDPSKLNIDQSGHPHTATERRKAVIDLLSNLDTAGLPDREIARRAGVSPSTVGTLRRKVVSEALKPAPIFRTRPRPSRSPPPPQT
ncbi:MAG: response regulator transcription factor [Alphaproteobacteria bacterium]|nr:response regulator transcription factor [Alphaproteobacteria bacterium]